MKKIHRNGIFALACLSLLSGINGGIRVNNISVAHAVEGDSYQETDLSRIFVKLMKNNFTFDLTYINNFESPALTSSSRFYYTEYSFETEGNVGVEGVAQSDECIFRYSYDSNGDIVPSTPTIQSSTGMRYAEIYEFTTSFQNINLSNLPTEKDEEGYYNYEFGNDDVTDSAMREVFFRQNGGLWPEKLKIKVVGSTLEIKGTLYGNKNSSGSYDIEGYVTDIGTTENKAIKDFLDAGGEPLEPLDKRFLRFFNPYFYSNNYTMELDARNYLDESSGKNSTFHAVEKSTENAIYTTPVENPSGASGVMSYMGAVHTFDIKNGKVNVLSTPVADADDFSYYSDIYGDGGAYYSLSDLDFSSLSGYIDPSDPDVYVITDSQFCYYFGETVFLPVSDSTYYTSVTIEILDDEKHEFQATINPRNKNNGRDLGTYTIKFYDLNQTEIPEVDEYISICDEPVEDKTTLKKVLDAFKGNNYSMDILSSGGVGLCKIYFTSDYMYQVAYGSESSNFGYMKVGDSIYEFAVDNGEVKLDTNVDYATKGMTLPGVGTYFQADDDASYLSCLDDAIYDYDKYEIDSIDGISYYRNKTSGFAQKALNYLLSSYTDILPQGAGFRVSDKDGDLRATFLVAFSSKDGKQSSYTTMTFYDIGTTSFSLIDEYIKNNA